MMLIELVGPNTRCLDELNKAQTNPPTTTDMITISGGNPAMSANPMACGIDTSDTVDPAIKSAFNLTQE